MPTEIVMPKLSDTMTEGKLISWKKSVGDQVVRGDTIAEVETDKATMELEAFTSGPLLETRAKPGETVPVGSVIALIGAPEEHGREEKEETGVENPPPEPQELPGEPFKPSQAEATKEEGKPQPSRKPAAEAGAAGPASGGEKASPLVRRLARERGVDLAAVQGSGPEGRILQEDLERYLQQRRLPEEEKPVPHEEKVQRGEPGEGTDAGEGLSRMRAAIARIVTESWQTIPHFSVSVSVEMDGAEQLRHKLKEAGLQLTITDLLVKAAAVALGRYPQLNASFVQNSIQRHPDINIGIAVALDDGLMVPVIKGCGSKTLKEIAAAGRDVVGRVRNGAITEEHLFGGTFTISNLGMYGVDAFTAVIYPPQAAILAVGAVHEKPVIREGLPGSARVMQLTLSADHRVIDGIYAARFLAELKNLLVTPVSLLV